jgi:EAL and modified HD-GYP domain-containing signal transduction protein
MSSKLATAQRKSEARNCLVSRQPIFEPTHQVFGYELLFPISRSAGGDSNASSNEDGGEGASRVLRDTLSVFGLQQLAEGRRAFIPFSCEALLQGYANLFPREQAVIMPQNVRAAPGVFDAFTKLKKDGYSIAVSFPVQGRGGDSLLDMADIIKIDWRVGTPDDRRQTATRFAACGKRMLAERVESWQEYRDALAWGYGFFQGSFFCQPQVLASKELPPSRLAVMRLLAELGKPRVNMSAVEEIFKQDPPLALKVFAYLNSALFGRRYDVTSIRRAVVLLGLTNLRRWVSMFAVSDLAEGHPPELFRASLIRGRFCELIGGRAGLGRLEFDLFLVGLLSSIDALLGRPLKELLNQLAISENVRDALAGRKGALRQVYTLIRAYEGADWDGVADTARTLGLERDRIVEDYMQSLRWAAEACGQSRPDQR